MRGLLSSIITLSLLLTGCASGTRWSRSTAEERNDDEREFLKDRYTCLSEAKRDQDLFNACMRVKGYVYRGLTPDPAGEFVPRGK